MSILTATRTWAWAIVLITSVAQAQASEAPAGSPGAGFSEQLGRHVPSSLAFHDQHGHPVQVGEFFDGRRPVLLVPAYYHCPMLCGLVLNAAVTAAKGIDWTPGDQYRVVVVSFDHDEGPAEAIQKQQAVLAAAPGDPRFTAPRWPFLTGTQPAIDALLGSIGEQVHYDGNEFAHPAIMVVLSGDGVVSRYFYGVELAPRDLKFALLEASSGRTGSIAERVLMYCYHYDPAQHRYGLFVVGFLRVGGVVVLALFVLLIWWLVRRARRQAVA